MDAHAETEAVEERHGREHLVPDAEHRVGSLDLLAEGVEVQVRQQDALGGAGGAAGVEDDRGIVRPACDLVIPEAGLAQAHELVPHDDGRVLGDLFDLAALGEHVAHAQRPGERVPDPGKDDVDDLGVLADGLELVVELIEGHDRDRLGLVEVEFQLLLAGQGVDHVADGADHVHGVEHVDGLRAVRHRDGDLVVFPHADGAQALGAFMDVLDHLPVGGGLAHEVEGDVVGVRLRHVLEHADHRALIVVQRRGDLAQAREPGLLCSDFHVVLFSFLFFSRKGIQIVFEAALPPQKHHEASNASPRADQARLVPRKPSAMSASSSISKRCFEIEVSIPQEWKRAARGAPGFPGFFRAGARCRRSSSRRRCARPV